MSEAEQPASQAPRPAATAIVVRELDGQIEVLMTRRHADLAFMGGMWVFPGGTLAPADRADAARARMLNAARNGYVMHDLSSSALPGSLALSLAFAAGRETFEETGILLATRADGSPCSAEQLARLQAERRAIAKEPERFVAVLEREELFLDLARLIYWAHWITPAPATRRFDTRFFVAAAPASQAFEADRYETTECAWMAPAELLAAADRGDMRVASPTRCNLAVLQAAIARHGTLDTLLRAESARRVPPVLPKFHRDGERYVIVYPWDPEYRSLPGESVSERDAHYEPALVAGPSRVTKDH